MKEIGLPTTDEAEQLGVQSFSKTSGRSKTSQAAETSWVTHHSQQGKQKQLAKST